MRPKAGEEKTAVSRIAAMLPPMPPPPRPPPPPQSPPDELPLDWGDQGAASGVEPDLEETAENEESEF